ncbi:hypothetical protein AMTR_s00050p00225930 [Amborella trichopoda]|uniref:Uncharacterized protein n=1 Tax=Amborella trichopoda TaxID=13333 RepID=W1PSE2_AMBTC|nr:hypothetical protein AMTR_s00050p00225930 [Amborella trichopoda]
MIGKANKVSLSPVSSLPQKGIRKPKEDNNNRKHGRRSQLDMPDITPTKEDAKKSKKRKDNGNIGMVAQSSEANASQNNQKPKIMKKVNAYQNSKKAKTKTQDSGEKKTRWD